jgi:hypothetical protein
MKIGDIVLVEDDDFNPSFKFIREIDIIDYYETEFGKYSHYNPIASRFSKPGVYYTANHNPDYFLQKPRHPGFPESFMYRARARSSTIIERKDLILYSHWDLTPRFFEIINEIGDTYN